MVTIKYTCNKHVLLSSLEKFQKCFHRSGLGFYFTPGSSRLLFDYYWLVFSSPPLRKIPGRSHQTQAFFQKHILQFVLCCCTLATRYLQVKRISQCNKSRQKEYFSNVFLDQIRTQRTLPLICGTVKRFLLFGDHDGDVFATGGEMEIVQVCTV